MMGQVKAVRVSLVGSWFGQAWRGTAVMARSGEVCWGQECFGMVRQSLARQGLDWFGKAVVVSRVRDR